MTDRISRRRFVTGTSQLAALAAGCASGGMAAMLRTPRLAAAEINGDRLRDRVEGLLIGSMIGDAAGGPVEFKSPDVLHAVLPRARGWHEGRRLDEQQRRDISRSFSLLAYGDLRPEPEPYAHWRKKAPAGTITDDSRHKLILLRALRKASAENAFPITQRELAEAYVAYPKSPCMANRPGYAALCNEWLSEYNRAARWVLGERDPRRALPPERLWGGIPTNAGQMALLPLAAIYAGQPEQAYKAAYRLGFMDNGLGKDFNSAVVAGLSTALVVEGDADLEINWNRVFRAMADTDPYRYGDVPWVRRSVAAWLEFADDAVRQADGRPARLLQYMEKNIQAKYWWDAHVPLASAVAILKFCAFDPLPAVQLSLAFGHDTDSTAQLVGAFAGAFYGTDAFPASARRQVAEQLVEDYDESIDEIVALLRGLAAEIQSGRQIVKSL